MADHRLQAAIDELVDINKNQLDKQTWHTEMFDEMVVGIRGMKSSLDRIAEVVTGQLKLDQEALDFQSKQSLLQQRKDKEKDDKKTCDEGKDKTDKLAGTYFGDIRDSFKDTTKGFGQTITKLKDTWKLAFGSIMSFATWIGTSFTGLITTIRGLGFSGLLKAIGRLALPITAALAVIEGLITAFDYFNEAGDGAQSKLMAGLQGFLTGISSFLLAPLDWLVNGIGDFFGIEMLQSFSAVETAKEGIDLLFNIFEDIGQVLGEVYDSFMESSFVAGFKEIWASVTSAFDGFLEGMKETYNSIAEYVPGLPMIGEDTREEGLSSEDIQQPRKERNEAMRDARNSGLYDSNIWGDSKIDREMVAKAPTSQLKAILHDDDLSDEDYKFVEDEVLRRMDRGSKRGMDLGSTDTSMKEDGKRGMDLGSTDTSVKADGKRGMDLGSTDTSVKADGKRGADITGRRKGQSRSPSAPAAPEAPPASSASNMTYAVRDSSTQSIVSTHSSTEEATTEALKIGGYVTSEPSKVGRGDIKSAMSPATVQSAPSPTSTGISPSPGMQNITNNLSMEQQRLENTKAQQSSQSSMNVVSAPTSNTNVSNTTNVQSGNIVVKDPTDSMYGNYKSRR